jgi:hypothetical protein
MRKMMRFGIVLMWAFSLAGCTGHNGTQQRMLSGAAIGAGLGSAAAAVSGGAILTGAVAGAAVGTVGGLVMDNIHR